MEQLEREKAQLEGEVRGLKFKLAELHHSNYPHYNPFEEKKVFSLKEWIDLSRAELARYLDDWLDANDHHRGSHTWNEWWDTFHRYMSW